MADWSGMPHLSAFTVVVFLLAAYRIQSKETWNWQDIAMVAGSLAVVTYGYSSGRVLAPLFALGLLLFATTKHRFLGVVKIWLAYGVTSGTTHSVQSVASRRANKAALRRFVHHAWHTLEKYTAYLSLSGATWKTRA